MADIESEKKQLIEECPFLRIDDEASWLDMFPEGWLEKIAFPMSRKIKNALIKEDISLDDYRILDIKEKYGILCWYDAGGTETTDKIIDKYEMMSMLVCLNCGKPTHYYSIGWINYLCDDCAKKSTTKTVRLTEKDIPATKGDELYPLFEKAWRKE